MRQGIAIDGNGELKVKNGTLCVEETDFQNIDQIIRANKGDFKEFPVFGVGAERYLKSTGRVEQFRREIMLQLETDGYKNPVVKIETNGQLTIDL